MCVSPKEQSVGLFLGAGASYELGMPLAWDLTAEFKGYFTPVHLHELNTSWRLQGGGFHDSVIETAVKLINRSDLHYETILGYLQTISRRPFQPHAEEYNELYIRMVEIISQLLLHRQIHNLGYIQAGLPPFAGLRGFVKAASAVWAFSTNHDLMLQLVAYYCGIPLRDGSGLVNRLPLPLTGLTLRTLS